MKARTALLAAFVAILGLTTAAFSVASLFDPFGHGVPLETRTKFSKQGFTLRQDFKVGKYCNYDVDLRLVHGTRTRQELQSLLVGNAELPLTLNVDIYRYTGENAERVAQLSNAPRMTGWGAEVTILRSGSLRLDKGRYRVEASTTGEAPQLEGVEADFVMQMRPKTNCPKKDS